MDWIKRNLVFVVSGAVAVLLMGAAGFYAYFQFAERSKTNTEMEELFGKLNELYDPVKNPGDEATDKVDKTKTARQYQQKLMALRQEARKSFVPVPPIPNSPNLTQQETITALRRTLSQLAREASNVVQLPGAGASGPLAFGQPDASATASAGSTFTFSFTAQNGLLEPEKASLHKLAQQVGEVKALCEVLFRANVVGLDGLRRERISSDDTTKGSASDYVDLTTISNDMAVLHPYEVTVRCFSGSLATVLSELASSPYGFIVKSINIEPAAPLPESSDSPAGTAPGFAPQPYQPGFRPPPPGADAPSRINDMMRRRYGIGAEGKRPVAPQPVAPPAYTYQPAPAAAAGKPGAVQMLNERQLKVTLVLYVLRLND